VATVVTAFTLLTMDRAPRSLLVVLRSPTRASALTLALGRTPSDDELAADMGFAPGELSDRLPDLIESLPPREETVIRLLHYAQVPRDDVALSLEITYARVDQLETLGVLKLRSMLKPGAGSWPGPPEPDGP
jgi:DNA-directed RNA polymerase specialized sigma24 family protein